MEIKKEDQAAEKETPQFTYGVEVKVKKPSDIPGFKRLSPAMQDTFRERAESGEILFIDSTPATGNEVKLVDSKGYRSGFAPVEALEFVRGRISDGELQKRVGDIERSPQYRELLDIAGEISRLSSELADKESEFHKRLLELRQQAGSNIVVVDTLYDRIDDATGSKLPPDLLRSRY